MADNLETLKLMKKGFTIDDLKKTKVGSINAHLFTGNDKMKPWLPEVVADNIPEKKSKYGNKKVIFDGIKFDSKKEGNRYLELKGRQMAGEISDLRFQVVYDLEINGFLICSYIADFTYKENALEVVEDVKSKATRKLPVYRIKNKLMQAILGIIIKEV